MRNFLDLREYPEQLFGERQKEADARYALELAQTLRDESLLVEEFDHTLRTLCDVLERLKRSVQ